MDCINIGSRREVFWDEALIDTQRTTAVLRLHEPVQRECVLTYDDPWGGDCAVYNVVIQDGDLYRMYTRISNGKKGNEGNVCYAESRDGIHWVKPMLNMVEFEGSKENNLMFDFENRKDIQGFDSFKPFIDENPACLPNERYKAIGNFGTPLRLQLFTSADGIHFDYKGPLAMKGTFDTVNTVFYNRQTGNYQAFIRDFHPNGDPSYHLWTRDIRFTESDSLQGKAWPLPQQLRYDSMTDWQMYINSVMKYYRADHMYIGFPSRYVERSAWTENYDELCGSESRRERFEREPRFGLAVSDTLFMVSRDGLNWKRYPEAFLRPGPEHPTNWVYGSVYFSNGLVETASAHPGCDNELSFYCAENRWSGKPAQIWRYTIRMDGFASVFGSYPEADLYTKPFVYDGSEMRINFSTSAYGHLKIDLQDIETGRKLTSVETFGDSTDRRVRFADGSAAELSGRPVIMHVNMCDADLYSMKFGNE